MHFKSSGRRFTCATRYFTGQPVRCKVLITFPHEVRPLHSNCDIIYRPANRLNRLRKGARVQGIAASPRLTVNLSKPIFYRPRAPRGLSWSSEHRVENDVRTLTEEISIKRLETSSTSALLDRLLGWHVYRSYRKSMPWTITFEPRVSHIYRDVEDSNVSFQLKRKFFMKSEFFIFFSFFFFFFVYHSFSLLCDNREYLYFLMFHF